MTDESSVPGKKWDWKSDAKKEPVVRGPTPAYYQVSLFFRKRIDSGVLSAGEQTPTESEIMEAFGVSRHTARNAIQALVVDRLVEKFPGRGTFVLEKPLVDSEWVIGSFDEFLKQRYPGTPAILETNWIRETEFEYSTAMHESWESKPFLRVSLVRRSKGRALSFAIIDIPDRLAQKIEHSISEEISSLPIMTLVEQASGQSIETIQQTVSSAQIDRHIAENLGVDEGSHVLKLINNFMNTNGDSLEISQIFFNENFYEHIVQLSRRKAR